MLELVINVLFHDFWSQVQKLESGGGLIYTSQTAWNTKVARFPDYRGIPWLASEDKQNQNSLEHLMSQSVATGLWGTAQITHIRGWSLQVMKALQWIHKNVA